MTKRLAVPVAVLFAVPVLWLSLWRASSAEPKAPVADDRVAARTNAADSAIAGDRDRSPVDLVLTADDAWLLTANQTSDSVSLIRTADGTVVTEQPCGRRPTALALVPGDQHLLVSCTASGELWVFHIEGESLAPAGIVPLGFEPRGIAVAPDGKLRYVALAAANEVAVVDLQRLAVEARIAVGKWPRYLVLTPDGSRLAVGASGDGGISVVDTQARTKLYDTTFMGLNIGHVQTSADGVYAYFPWMVYADRPITSGNIREGWVLGNRVARVRLDSPARAKRWRSIRVDRPWATRMEWP